MSMSRKPTSASERTAAIEHLERCGWSNAELIWEQIQEAAAQAWLDGDADQAAELWQGALEVAEAHLAPHDPRRVTSRVNASVGGASEDAVRDWSDGESWVAELAPPVRARSSTFHLRLRAKHPGGYERPGMQACRELFRQGLAQLRGDGGALSFARRVAQWHEHKPAGYNDYRKLLAAVLLLRYPE